MKTVFFDVDTQIDFLFPAGALYVPGAERLLPALQRLNQYAAARGIPVVSTTDAHLEDDPEFQEWPPHCVLGTTGQQKAAATLLENRVVVPRESTDPALAPQILLQKRHVDMFVEPNIAPLLARLAADEYVVYGVVTEVCVHFAVQGLLRTGKPVRVVADAIKEFNSSRCAPVLEAFRSSGVLLTTTSEFR